MGYSVSTRAVSAEKKGAMMAFLLTHYTPWSALTGDEDEAALRLEPSYDKDELAIGFDYRTLTGAEREYIWTVTRWIALRVGQTYQSPIVPEETPFIVYDGHEVTPVVVRTEEVARTLPYALERYCCNTLGVTVSRTPNKFNIANEGGPSPNHIPMPETGDPDADQKAFYDAVLAQPGAAERVKAAMDLISWEMDRLTEAFKSFLIK